MSFKSSSIQQQQSSSKYKVGDYKTRLPLTALLLPVPARYYSVILPSSTTTATTTNSCSPVTAATGWNNPESSSPRSVNGAEYSSPRLSSYEQRSPVLTNFLQQDRSASTSHSFRWSLNLTNPTLGCYSISEHRLHLEAKWRQSNRISRISDSLASNGYLSNTITTNSVSNSSSDSSSSSLNENDKIGSLMSGNDIPSPLKGHSSLGALSNRNVVELNFEKEESTFGSVETLRNRYLDFVKMQGKENKRRPAQDLDIDFEVKLMFLDYMYDGPLRKPSKNLKDVPTLMNALETYCHNIVFNFDGWHASSEKSDEPYPYLKYTVEKIIPKRYSWFCHDRFSTFLKNRYENNLTNSYPPLRSDEIHLKDSSETTTNTMSPRSLSNSREQQTTAYPEPKQMIVGLLDEIHMLCDMFFYDLEDLFVLFQEKYQNYVHHWVEIGLKNDHLPLHVIEVYRKKLEYNETMQSQLTIDSRDFLSTNIIDKDWKFLRYLSKEYSPDWYISYQEKRGNVIQWSTKQDYSTDKQQLRTAKVIDYYDLPIQDVVKTFCCDNHFSNVIEDVKYYDYNPINFSNSHQKYPSTTVSGVFNLKQLFSKRPIEMVLSSKTTFVGNELTEHMLMYRSCEIPALDAQRKKKNKPKYMGLRFITKVDTNRTRCVELRCGNIGGMANANLIINNPLVNKKVAKSICTNMRRHLAQAQQEGFPFPSLENNLARVWMDYCKQYCNIDVKELFGTSSNSTLTCCSQPTEQKVVEKKLKVTESSSTSELKELEPITVTNSPRVITYN
ncbi:hypothetical protein C9374_002784 [Naegleria lovaniensis]|uniref:Uncharacterized protein n=1 Tax=Naegleria lovaniensis TaxID=51637 RepID=A0AA88GUR0_NAELO|nr:uncharacterized protein C9374_002784 [Naegleria lovaniensis]KAG2386338.1 hypothetical protein C9374_002784 [Naegleria lovaniensis]